MTKKKIVILSNNDESPWLTAVNHALIPLGNTTIWTEKDALKQFRRTKFDLLLIDASSVDNDIASLVQLLHLENEWVPIVVATTSPTWRRARDILLAGASDYIGRSFEPERIRAKCRDAMEQRGAPVAVWE